MNKIILLGFLLVACCKSNLPAIRTACFVSVEEAVLSPKVREFIKNSCLNNAFEFYSINSNRCLKDDNTLGYSYYIKIKCEE